MSQVGCAWCHQKGHCRRDCNELKKYKADKDADRERNKSGDRPYWPPQRGARRPLRGAGSLDDDFDEAIGLTGDCDALDEDVAISRGAQ